MLDYEGYDYESEVEANRLRGKLREQENKLTDWETRLAKVEGYHYQVVAAHEKRISKLECRLRTMKAKLRLSNAKIKNLEAKLESYDEYYSNDGYDYNEEDTCGAIAQESETSNVDARATTIVDSVLQGKSDTGESSKENFSEEPLKKRRKSSRIRNLAVQDPPACSKDAEVVYHEYGNEANYFPKVIARPKDQDESSSGQYEGEDEMTLSEESSPRSYNGFSAGESHWQGNPGSEAKQKQADVDEKIRESVTAKESDVQDGEHSDHDPQDEECDINNEDEDCDVENEDEDCDVENEDEDCDVENEDEDCDVENEDEDCDVGNEDEDCDVENEDEDCDVENDDQVWNVENGHEYYESEILEKDIPAYECPLCNALFRANNNLHRHIEVFHNSQDAVPSEQKEGLIVYKCASCDAVFKKKKHLRRHAKFHTIEDLAPSSSEQVSDITVSVVNAESEFISSTEVPSVLDETPTKAAYPGVAGETHVKVEDLSVRNGTPAKEEDLSVRNETPAEEENMSLRNKTLVKEGIKECGCCFKRFPHSYRLKAHNDGIKQFPCRGCSATFLCRDGFRAHAAKCELYGGARCDLCAVVFSDFSTLKRHMARLHVKKKEPKDSKKCPRCPKVCYSANSYREHVKLCNQKCLTCKKVFSTPSSLAKHVRNVHPLYHDDTKRTKGGRRKLPTKRPTSQSPEQKATAPKPKTVVKTSQPKPTVVSVNLNTLKEIPECSTCGKTFASNSSLQRHMQTHEKGKGYVCLLCKAESGSWFDFEKHVDSTHPESKGTEKRLAPLSRGRPSVKKFICSQCSMEVSSKESLLKHFTVQHAWLKPFKCGKCGASFTTTERLKKHESQHT